MNKKYFDTRKDSLEDKINTIASEQASISKPQTDVKLSVEKKYFESKKGSLEDIASKVVSESKLDPVNKDAVKKKFDDRKDKDIDNDGDTDSTDKYLHKRRAAVSKNIKEKAISTKGATRKPTSASDRLYLSNPNEHRRRQELEFTYKRILASMPEKERNSKEGKIQAMDLARVRSAKNEKDLAKNMKHKGTLKIAENPLMALGRTAAAAAGTAAGTAVGNKIGDKITSQKKHKEVDEACWDSHKQVGTKMKGGKQVPNCVPKNEAVNQDDHGEKINQDKKDAAMKKTDQKKTFDKLRQETKLVRLGNNGKTDTGQKAAVIDLEPSARPI